MQVIWIHERATHAGGAERYVLDCAARLRARGVTSTLLYDPSLPTSAAYLGSFAQAFPLVDPDRQLATLSGDLIFAHRVPAHAEAALARAPLPVLRMFHDHQLFCLREHKITAARGEICTRAVGLGCYPCGGFVRRHQGTLQLATLGGLRQRQRQAFAADAILVASDYLAREAVAHGVRASQITTLPLYAPARIGRSGPGEGVVFVGQLVRGKGVDVLIEAVARTGTPTIVIGDGPERAALEAQATAARAAVTFTGWLPEQEVAARVARARAVVMPSRVPETFGMVGVEAMALGTPTIASMVGGVGAWLTPEVTGLAVPPGDPVALASAIRRLVDDDLLAQRLGLASRAHHLAAFTPERHLLGLHTLMTTLVRGRREFAMTEEA